MRPVGGCFSLRTPPMPASSNRYARTMPHSAMNVVIGAVILNESPLIDNDSFPSAASQRSGMSRTQAGHLFWDRPR